MNLLSGAMSMGYVPGPKTYFDCAAQWIAIVSKEGSTDANKKSVLIYGI